VRSTSRLRRLERGQLKSARLLPGIQDIRSRHADGIGASGRDWPNERQTQNRYSGGGEELEGHVAGKVAD
jgi:hypothetical protein